jgi:hypothetical protein
MDLRAILMAAVYAIASLQGGGRGIAAECLRIRAEGGAACAPRT